MAADQSGRLLGFRDPLEKWEPLVAGLENAHKEQDKPEPLVSGADLINLGFKPGPDFKALLQKTADLQQAGYSRDQILNQIKK